MTNAFGSSPRGILYLATFAVLAGAAISTAFIATNWAYITLRGAAYYYIFATVFGSVHSMLTYIQLVVRRDDNHRPIKLVYISLCVVVGIMSLGSGIVFAINANDAFNLDKIGIRLLNPYAFLAGTVLSFLGAIFAFINSAAWSRV